MGVRMEVQKNIQTLIFDWDGTLHDTESLYGESLRQTLKWLETQGYAVPADQSDARFRKYLGINAVDMWKDFMPELLDSMKKACSQRTGDNIVRLIQAGKARMYPRAMETLRELQKMGYRLVILSNCKVSYMDAQRAFFGLDEVMEDYYCCGAYDFRPKEEIFPYIQKKFPAGYCMIGDRASDRKVSDCWEIPFIGCSYGFGDAEELAGSDGILDAIDQLPAKLQELNTARI